MDKERVPGTEREASTAEARVAAGKEAFACATRNDQRRLKSLTWAVVSPNPPRYVAAWPRAAL